MCTDAQRRKETIPGWPQRAVILDSKHPLQRQEIGAKCPPRA